MERKLTKAEVVRLHSEGKNLDEIAEYFISGWNGKLQLLKAKIALYMSGKKTGGPKKKKAKTDNETSDINSHVEQAENEGSEQTDLIGHFSEERCPECGSHLLVNKKGDKWCSFVGGNVEAACAYGFKYPDIKAAAADLEKEVSEVAKASAMNINNDIDEMMELVPDNINSPAHYTFGGIETTDYIQAKLTPEGFEGFCIGTVIQYLSRYRLKGGLMDLKKAEWYLNRIIKVKEA
jgi:hypothetical protein